ncbi:hypothetical protein FA95DRAFT_1606506 [Auriscalpium vulgare]|uniref:Uncharacterized protein n=1 Tax=Auriscalpium vulgare TaxID=40419 RepID=A0ACB8RSR6_9AGAM|nr:hypothetical protein FA95DRAFT_1606506 [Auriscalpium vulgare]
MSDCNVSGLSTNLAGFALTDSDPMADTLRASQATSTVHLPLELWAKIFEFSAFVPGLLDIDVPDPFDTSTASTPNKPWDSNKLEGALRSLQWIVRVCKDWHALATPFLYRTVVIKRRVDIDCLQSALEASAARAKATEEPALGSRVRHLAVLISRSPEKVLSLTRYFPNLEILTVDSYAASSVSGMKILTQSCGASLLKLHIHGSFYAQHYADAILPMMPQLRTLICTEPQLPLVFYRPPKLVCLNIDATKPYDAEVTYYEPFPCVRHAVLEFPEPGWQRSLSASRPSWSKFIAFQGHLLTTLHINYASKYSRTVLTSIVRGCANLKHLILYLPELPARFSLGSLQRVPCLAIHFEKPPGGEGRPPSALVRSLLRLDYSFPRVVRLLNAENAQTFRATLGDEDVHSELRQMIAAGALRLQDPNGRLLGPEYGLLGAISW